MAIYKQNAQDNIGTTEQITRILLDDLSNYGDTEYSLYRQDEAIIMKILLATYHMDDPNLTVAAYLEAVNNKKMPSIIAVTRAIYRSMSENLPSYKENRKKFLEKIQIARPAREDIRLIVEEYEDQLNRTSMIVQYYINFHNVTKNTRLVDWLDLASKIDIPSLGFIDIFIMRQLDKNKKNLARNKI